MPSVLAKDRQRQRFSSTSSSNSEQSRTKARRLIKLRWRAAAQVLALVCMALPLLVVRTQLRAQKNDQLVTIWDYYQVPPCNPELGEESITHSLGCCGSPGRPQCNFPVRPSNTPCTYPPSNLVGADSTCYIQTLAHEQVNLLAPARDFTPTDFTFFVTSDIHIFRDTYDPATQSAHPVKLNNFGPLSGTTWPANNNGIPTGFVNFPTAVVVPGDLTTGARTYQLQAYRLGWESGNDPGYGINYPVYFGLGNHDISSLPNGFGANTADGGLMMRQYLYNRLGGLVGPGVPHMDSSGDSCTPVGTWNCPDLGPYGGSLNYSWDWQGVHMVMLNTWAGDQNIIYPGIGQGIGADELPGGIQWLANDLAYYVGNSGKPVILFQHYTFVDVGGVAWSAGDYQTFFNTIQNYNVIAMFAGHTHQLEVFNKGEWLSPGGLFENFVDGSAGDCSLDGGSEGCNGSDTTSNFLVVHVTDRFLDVGAVGWNPSINSGAPFWDNTWYSGTVVNGTSSTSSPVCRKRISTVPFTYLQTIPNENGSFTVTAGLSGPLRGPLALQFDDTKGELLSSVDFVDACTMQAGNEYLLVSEGDLQPLQSVTVNLPAGSDSFGSANLVQVGDVLIPSQYSLVAGAKKEGLSLSTASGRQINFTTAVSPAGSFTVTPSSSTTPATLAITANSVSPDNNATLTITPDDPSMNAVGIHLSAEPVVLSITSNIPSTANPQVLVGGAVTQLPAQFQAAIGQVFTVDAQDYSPNPQTKNNFISWSDSGKAAHAVTVYGNLTLNAEYQTLYEVTTSATRGGTIAPQFPEWVDAGANATLTATPFPGYTFTNFTDSTGQILGTTSPLTVEVTGPLSVTANFVVSNRYSNVPPPSHVHQGE
jgi:hypothetical protein